MPITLLETIEVETTADVSYSIIWLHGLGANGHDFEGVVPELKLPSSYGIRFVFPHAPQLPVTVNGGMLMPAWYDITAIDIDRTIDTAQLEHSAAAVHQLIDREIDRGIHSEKIIIAGFSQGGAVAYEAALSYNKPLAGLIALSTYFATQSTIECHAANESLPIFIGHGTEDTVVSEKLGQQAKQQLDTMAYPNSYHTYPMAHSVCMEEIADISQWIQKQLGHNN